MDTLVQVAACEFTSGASRFHRRDRFVQPDALGVYTRTAHAASNATQHEVRKLSLGGYSVYIVSTIGRFYSIHKILVTWVGIYVTRDDIRACSGNRGAKTSTCLEARRATTKAHWIDNIGLLFCRMRSHGCGGDRQLGDILRRCDIHATLQRHDGSVGL
jgi:hypothetical protein